MQVLQAAVTGLQPGQPYVLALASQPDGGGKLEPIANFMANPAGALKTAQKFMEIAAKYRIGRR